MHRARALVLTAVLSAFLLSCAQPQGASGPTQSPIPTVPFRTTTAAASMTPPEAPTAVPSATRRPLETPTLPTVTTAPTATQPPPSATPAPPTPPVPPTPEPAANTYVFPVDAETCTPSSSHHDYPASDIACPIGTAFVAVTSGVVDFVSWEDRYAQGSTDPADRGGLAVAIVGDDGVRYYGSHLSEVAEGITPGVRVETGQLLGRTGISGNAAGTYPQLHFGISRPTTPEDWATRRGQVWPQKYLAAWRRGEHVTPQLP